MIMDNPHRRLNPLTGEWVLVSPQRNKRPWVGRVEKRKDVISKIHDKGCYLCPGNVRANGKVNPDYNDTFVFTNDYAALLPDGPDFEFNEEGMCISKSVKGTSRVICFSPRHDITMAEMDSEGIRNVISVWIDQLNDLGKEFIWVQIFENKGDIMGCSNPHPHGQIWALDTLPNEIQKEKTNQQNYFKNNNSVLLLDYLNHELKNNQRIILENNDWVSLVPYWALWPYETMILPKRHIKRLNELTPDERESLAEILRVNLIKYDNLFETSFPYTMGWHGAPNESADYSYWQLHLHFYPPLLRSASVKKFMVGYELLSEAQRDITAEQAAEALERLSTEHYKSKLK